MKTGTNHKNDLSPKPWNNPQMSTAKECKRRKVARVCAILALSQLSCSPSSNTTKQPPEIKSIKTSSLVARFQLEHGSEITLNVGGRKFPKVRGWAPHYLPIKELNAVYFVTDGKNQQSVCHVFNLQTRKDIEIVTDFTELGYEIGSVGDRRETIEGVTNSVVVVARHYGNKKAVYSLDLKRRKVLSVQVQVLGDGTNIVYR